MHIHGNSMHIQSANFSSARLQNRAALEAQRAAETRKRLLKKSQSLEAESSADADAVLLIGHWLDPQAQDEQNQDGYRDAAEGRDPDFA